MELYIVLDKTGNGDITSIVGPLENLVMCAKDLSAMDRAGRDVSVSFSSEGIKYRGELYHFLMIEDEPTLYREIPDWKQKVIR